MYENFKTNIIEKNNSFEVIRRKISLLNLTLDLDRKQEKMNIVKLKSKSQPSSQMPRNFQEGVQSP